MESQRLLPVQPLEQNSEFLVRLRYGLLVFFWISFAVMTVVSILLVVQAYEPPTKTFWYHRRVLCSYVDLQDGNETDSKQAVRGASKLGCGGLFLRMTDVGSSVRSLVNEGQRYDIRILLDIILQEEYNISQEQAIKQEVRGWIDDGVSGFSLSGVHRQALMKVVGILQDELEGLGGDDRIVLLPDWLDKEAAVNKSYFLRTRPVLEGEPWEVNENSEVMKTAWEVSSKNSSELRQFMAVTLPGTIKLSLSQAHPPPNWLRSALFLRFQNPALYAGWLQTLSDNATHSTLSHWGCSTLLVTVNPSNQSQIFSLHLPHYTTLAQILLSTQRGRTGGKITEDSLVLAPGEAQVLRLNPQE